MKLTWSSERRVEYLERVLREDFLGEEEEVFTEGETLRREGAVVLRGDTLMQPLAPQEDNDAWPL